MCSPGCACTKGTNITKQNKTKTEIWLVSWLLFFDYPFQLYICYILYYFYYILYSYYCIFIQYNTMTFYISFTHKYFHVSCILKWKYSTLSHRIPWNEHGPLTQNLWQFHGIAENSVMDPRKNSVKWTRPLKLIKEKVVGGLMFPWHAGQQQDGWV